MLNRDAAESIDTSILTLAKFTAHQICNTMLDLTSSSLFINPNGNEKVDDVFVSSKMHYHLHF